MGAGGARTKGVEAEYRWGGLGGGEARGKRSIEERSVGHEGGDADKKKNWRRWGAVGEEAQAPFNELEICDKKWRDSQTYRGWTEDGLQCSTDITKEIGVPQMSTAWESNSSSDSEEIPRGGNHRRNQGKSETDVSFVLSHSQTEQSFYVEVASGLPSIEHPAPQEEVQDGEHRDNSRPVVPRGVLDLDRCEGCVPPHQYQSQVPAVLGLQGSWSELPMEDTADGPYVQPLPLDCVVTGGGKEAQRGRDMPVVLHGRLDCDNTLSGGVQTSHGESCAVDDFSGFDGEFGEIIAGAFDQAAASGFHLGYCEGPLESSPGQDSGSGHASSEVPFRPTLDDKESRPSSREDEFDGYCNSDAALEVEKSHERYADSAAETTPEVERLGCFHDPSAQDDSGSQVPLQFWVDQAFERGNPHPSEDPSGTGLDDRCQPDGMGCYSLPQGPEGEREVVPNIRGVDASRVDTLVECEGANCPEVGLSSIQTPNRGSQGLNHPHGQHMRVILSQGQHQIRSFIFDRQTFDRSASSTKNSLVPEAYSGSSERTSGQALSENPVGSRLEYPEASFSTDSGCNGPFHVGRICGSNESPNQTLLLAQTGPGGGLHRRAAVRLESGAGISLSAFSYHQQGDLQDRGVPQGEAVARLHAGGSTLGGVPLVASVDEVADLESFGAEGTRYHSGGFEASSSASRSTGSALIGSQDSEELREVAQFSRRKRSERTDSRARKDVDEYLAFLTSKRRSDNLQSMLLWLHQEIAPKTKTVEVFRRRIRHVDEHRHGRDGAPPYAKTKEVLDYLAAVRKKNPRQLGGRFLAHLGQHFDPTALIKTYLDKGLDDSHEYLRLGALLAVRTCALLRSGDCEGISRKSIKRTVDAIGRPIVIFAYIGKSERLRNVNLSYNYVEVLEDQPERCPAAKLWAYKTYVDSLQVSHDALFCGLQSAERPLEPLGSDMISNLMAKLMLECGINPIFSPHAVRAMVSEHLELKGCSDSDIDRRYSPGTAQGCRKKNYKSGVGSSNFARILWGSS